MGTLTWLRRGAAVVLAIPFLISGCDSSSPPTPETMSASPSSVIDGTVGQNVSVSVTVTGTDGQPYAGGVVSFTVTSGGGTVNPSTATTDQSGRASATWTLGQTAGTQQLTASLSPASATFQAEASAGAPASIQALTSYPGTYEPDAALPQDADFEVEDQYGNKVSGASVSFSASDNGTVSPAQGTTDSQGQASTTWTLGPRNGTQVLTATVPSVTPATVEAQAYDPCLDVQTLVLGGTITGNLNAESCETEVQNQLRFLDQYWFTLDQPQAFVFTVTSDFLNPAFYLFDPDLVTGLIANDNDVVYRAFLDATAPGTASRQQAAAASKTYVALVVSDAGGVGDYTLVSAASTGQMQNCERWVSTGILNTSQTLTLADDCGFTSGRQGHWITVYLEQGEGIAISMTSSELDPLVYVWGGGWDFLTSDDDSGTGANAYLEFTAETGGFYYVTPTTYTADEVGTYTVTISPLGSGSPPLAAVGQDGRTVLRLGDPEGETQLRDDGSAPAKKEIR